MTDDEVVDNIPTEDRVRKLRVQVGELYDRIKTQQCVMYDMQEQIGKLQDLGSYQTSDINSIKRYLLAEE